jgi:hypothetical protein
LAVLLAFAACAPTGMGWERAHTTDSERGADYDACAAEVRAETRSARGVDADVLASRGGDYQRAGLGQSFAEGVTGMTAQTEAALLNDCMAGKGYQHR